MTEKKLYAQEIIVYKINFNYLWNQDHKNLIIMILKKIPYSRPEADDLEAISGSIICESGVLGDAGDFVDGGDPLELF